MKKPRPKKCLECGERFQPVRAIQPVCEKFECKVAYATKAAERSKARREMNARREIREAKAKMKGRSDYIEELDLAFGAFIRLRDSGKPCICCGKPLGEGWVGGVYEAGHYISRRHMATRWDEQNVNAQRKYCNRRLSGNPVGYRAGLIERYGVETVERLEAAMRSTAHVSTEEIIEMIAKYKAKLKELKKSALA